MSRSASGFIYLFILIWLASCHKPFQTEKEEVAYWHALVLDSAYSKLYRLKDTTEALRLFDAAIKKTAYRTAFTKAARLDIVSNYYYFFTNNTEATAATVDAALGLFNTAALQSRYPRSYVGFLLFGGDRAYRLHQYNKANEYYFRAKNTAEKYLDPCEQKAFNYSIGMVLYRQQNFRKALDYFRTAYDLQNTCNPQTTAVILQQQEIQSNMGLCLLQLGQYDSALVHYDKALAIANAYRDSLGAISLDKIYGVIYGNKAQVYLSENKLDLAEQLCNKSIALNGRPGYEYENAEEVRLQLAEVYGRQGNYAGMMQVLQGLRGDLDTLPNATLELIWRRLAFAYYEKAGNPKQGLAAYRSYISLRDSISEQQQKLSAADVTRQMDVKDKEMQITLLKKDKQIALLWLWVTVGASLMGALILALIYHNYRRSKRNLAVSLSLNEEIKKQKTAREEEARLRHKEITEAMILAQENERASIGLELHDNVNQVLTTVKLHHDMVLEGMGTAQSLLPRATRYLQECINEIRSLSKRLSAPSLGKISLEESVNDLLDSVSMAGKVTIRRRIAGLQDQKIHQDLHLALYRILQEQLNNVLKHASASEVLVDLEKAGDKIRMVISDNGRGFSMHARSAGIGLKNMKTRAENMNGTFQVTSAPGAGCTVEVALPYT